MSRPRRLLARLRALMDGADAEGSAVLAPLAILIAAELATDVCSIYAIRPGDMLELVATVGLHQDAVGRTRLRVGEGIVGMVAATGAPQNLPDARGHPAFAPRPETGEECYASMLAVPVRRAGRTLGVITVQSRAPRHYGEEECELLETVAMLVAGLLATRGAPAAAPEGIAAAMPRRFTGHVLAPGVAIGPAAALGAGAPLRRLLAEDPQAELERLAAAAASMRRRLDELIDTSRPGADDARAVLEATRLVAQDGGWMRRVREAVGSGLSAEAAVQRVTDELRARMRRISDPYLRERLADIEELAGRLLEALGQGAAAAPVPRGAILVARRLGPAQLLDWHGRGIAGVVIEEGSPGGHAAILARALGLPALGGARGATEALEAGEEVVLDAEEGLLILHPEAEVRAAYERAIAQRLAAEAGFASLRFRPATSADGQRLSLQLNVGLALEVEQLGTTGADGIGLFRTEIAMLARGAITDLSEQAALYGRVLDLAEGRPVRFRTLDLGGDKLLPDAAPAEENPAMGWRSLRIGLDRPSTLRRQLRALLLGAQGRELSVMFPMVATLAEFRQARLLLLAEAARARPAPSRLLIGSMVEVPALLYQLPALAREADFLSIGSNDLLQFLFAADRGTPALASRYDLLSAPALDAIDAVRAAAEAAGTELSVCGEHASRPLEGLVLAALGITALSMPASALPRQKAVFARADLGELRQLLQTLRRNDQGAASLREPLALWARERGLTG